MPLPPFNASGDLPPGIHQATLAETLVRFGGGTDQRQRVAERLRNIVELALLTNHLEKLLVFGSFVTDKASPNDVDVILVMNDDFVLADCPESARILFDHAQATLVLGASVFWIRPSLLFLETMDSFIAHWQRKRDNTLRGIVEIAA